MSIKSELLLVLAGSLAAVLFFSILVVLSDGSYQGGDTYQHYLIARYALEHPPLLLDHWGKPVFTLLYSLPSSIGYSSAKIFTVILGVVSAFLTFLAGRELGQRHAWVNIPLVLFAPMFFIHLNSVMTEVLFSAWLTGGVYLLLRQRWITAAVLLSFLPFVRTEGFILLPFIAGWFLLHHKWKEFLLLGTGTVLYSLIGWLFHYHDFFWVFTHNPYPAESPYGSGQWLHFVNSNKVIWGLPLAICTALGLLFFLVNVARNKKPEPSGRAYTWLVLIPFFVFLVFHSAAWATGSLASNGETRVMVCTLPLASLIAVYGLDRLQLLTRGKMLFLSVLITVLVLVVITPFRFFRMPLARSAEQQLVHEACEVIANQYTGRRVHFIDPQVAVELDIDLWDSQDGVQWFSDPAHPEQTMQRGDIVVWDGHFCPYEGSTPLESFAGNPHFRNIGWFKPEKPIVVFGKSEYLVAIFECVE